MEFRSSPSRRVATRALIVVLVAVMTWWVVTLNRVDVQTTLTSGSQSFVVELPDPEPLIATISPARRVEGTEVLIDGRMVAHPPGQDPGQIVISLEDLAPGKHSIEIRVPRPTWTPNSVEIEIEVLPDPIHR